jgi:hypothetical protein
MSVHTTPDQAPNPTPPSEPPYPWRVGLALVALALVLGGVFFGATQMVNRSAAGDQQAVAPTETAIALAVATAAAAPVQTSAPRATAAPQATTAPQAAVVPTAAATAAPQLAPPLGGTVPDVTSVPTAPAATSQPIEAPTPQPTVFSPTITPVDPALDEEVRTAYLHYFDVRDQALYANDPTGLDAVADDPALAGLEQEIADDQAQGKAQMVDISHRYSIVHIEGDPDDVVAVVDYYKDLSFWVDANTHEPLPGQSIPSSPDRAPQVNVVYRLRNEDGVWKVIQGYPNLGSEISP